MNHIRKQSNNGLSAILLAAGLAWSGAASAEGPTKQWIITNPAGPLPAAWEMVREMKFGATRYWVVKERSTGSRGGASMMALRKMPSQGVNPDFPIGLIQTEDENTPPAPPSEDSGLGWHLRSMKYDQLPVDKAGKGVIVAVVDTGVDLTHPALIGKLWTNAGEIPANGIDDDGNGYIDDVHGYDFAANDSDPSDTYGHGTHCAGIVASDKSADGNAGGAAPEAQIMAIRLLTPSDGTTLMSQAALAVRYAVDNGAKILTNSWRVYSSWGNYAPTETNAALLKDAIIYAQSKGAIFVAAAGNENYDLNHLPNDDKIYPIGFTGLTNMVGVASSGSGLARSYFSNYGTPNIMLAAPGEDIYSTYLNGGWTSMSGTSMATPLVAGILARGLSAGMTPEEAALKLIATSTPMDPWKDLVVAGGIINPEAYLAPVTPPAPPVDPVPPTDPVPPADPVPTP